MSISSRLLYTHEYDFESLVLTSRFPYNFLKGYHKSYNAAGL